jgi:hypothetical protein
MKMDQRVSFEIVTDSRHNKPRAANVRVIRMADTVHNDFATAEVRRDKDLARPCSLVCL